MFVYIKACKSCDFLIILLCLTRIFVNFQNIQTRVHEIKSHAVATQEYLEHVLVY